MILSLLLRQYQDPRGSGPRLYTWCVHGQTVYLEVPSAVQKHHMVPSVYQAVRMMKTIVIRPSCLIGGQTAARSAMKRHGWMCPTTVTHPLSTLTCAYRSWEVLLHILKKSSMTPSVVPEKAACNLMLRGLAELWIM